MITEFHFDRWGWFNLETDDWCIHDHIPKVITKSHERKWDKKTRKVISVPVEYESTYDEWETETGFAYRYTQFPIVLSHYLKLELLTVDQYLDWMKELEVPEMQNISLPQSLGPMNMRDDQMEILSKLMTKRFGLCHVYTGFGKTEMIAYMCYYYTRVLGWKVLVTSPNAKVLDEITLRINSKLGVEIGVNYPNDSMVLAINAASVAKQSYNHHNYSDYLSDVKVILADEAEACLTPTHHQIYDYCKNRECMYGFSATPDCYCGKLDIYAGITDASFRSKHLLDTFGGSLVNLVPEGFDITIVNVKLAWWKVRDKNLAEYTRKFLASNEELDLPENYRTQLDNDLFIRPEIPKLLGTLSQTYCNLMITINRTEIIDYWVSQLPEYKIIEVSGRGYRFRFNGEIHNITQKELKERYLEADLIFGSRSLMRGVDLPDLTNSVQLSGKKAGSTIQSIGRTARKKKMTVIILKPKDFIFGYSSHNRSRINLIHQQYPPELNNYEVQDVLDFYESV